ncbi:MAG: methionyl-tRNA formyltransferase [Candidatus Nanopelagicales bacterium]|jgi:methionyl-tRNA formyltransferase|nr:methionyl-tRNA formyltransferase [Candidatus Nanopelagicales bacterium]MDP4666851.1 methionyl-tRNA formyltransferase [Candidatus Nanopelagicales bacterium]MDP4895795.1 methionyl-tRNA formyltransferase [Candidatus Nanopelagicales bacterium]MDP5050324.1 methionyl-tRNA formyltransferase [Candidatus Nanopelagicales bacterium]
MKIAFAGTPLAAVPTLTALLASDHEVALVVTRPDAPAGRGRTLTSSPVADVAGLSGVPVLKTSDLMSHRDKFAEVDCVIVVAFGAMVPRELLAVPKFGWINVHFSLLPHWRGAAPVQYAILSGDEFTGVTTFQIDEGLDTGPMLAYLTTQIEPGQTATELLDRLSIEGAQLALATLTGVENGSILPLHQPIDGISHAPKVTVSDARVRWNDPALAVDRRIRAVTKEPGAWTMQGEVRIKLGPVTVSPHVTDLAPGQVELREGEVLIGTGSHAIALGTVHEAGRNVSDAKVWFNNQNSSVVFE